MIKFLIILTLLSFPVFADTRTDNPSIRIATEDNSVNLRPRMIKVTNLTLTDGGNGVAILSTSGLPVNLSVNPVSRPLNTSFQVSTTNPAMVFYSLQTVSTISLLVGQTATAFLEISPDNINWTEQNRINNGNTGVLSIGLNITQTVIAPLAAMIPKNYYVRIRTTGTGAVSYISGQETVIG